MEVCYRVPILERALRATDGAVPDYKWERWKRLDGEGCHYTKNWPALEIVSKPRRLISR